MSTILQDSEGNTHRLTMTPEEAAASYRRAGWLVQVLDNVVRLVRYLR